MSTVKGNGDYIRGLTKKEIEQFKKAYDAKNNKNNKNNKKKSK